MNVPSSESFSIQPEGNYNNLRFLKFYLELLILQKLNRYITVPVMFNSQFYLEAGEFDFSKQQKLE